MQKLFLFIFSFLFFNGLFAQDNHGRIIVQLDASYPLEKFIYSLEEEQTTDFRYVKMLYPEKKIILIASDPFRATDQFAKQSAESMEGVQFVEIDHPIEYRQEPSDYWFWKQWDMEIIHAPQAWNVSTGGMTVDGDVIVSAIIDDGFYVDQEDLKDNIFRNEADFYGDMNNDGCPGVCGVDDDGDGLIDEDRNGFVPGQSQYDQTYFEDDDENGYIDDYRGLNIDTGKDSLDKRNHGTSVAGIIGAKGDNEIGVAGINWDIKMLPISGASFQSEVIEAYSYVLDFRKKYNKTDGAKGAFITSTNFSAGIDFANASDFPLWCAMYDSLGTHGILSVGATTNKNVDVDIEGDMPSTCGSPYLITVTNSNDKDEKVGNAGHGATHIDLAAPGNGSWTIDLGGDEDYGIFGGTSSATPHVTGAISLLMSMDCQEFLDLIKEDPTKIIELKQIVLDNVDQNENLQINTLSGGRLNIFSATEALGIYCQTSVKDSFGIEEIMPNPVINDLHIEYSTENYEKISLEIFNAIGQRVYTSNFSPPFFGEKSVTIDVSAFPIGVYFVSLSQDKRKSTKKILIFNY